MTPIPGFPGYLVDAIGTVYSCRGGRNQHCPHRTSPPKAIRPVPHYRTGHLRVRIMAPWGKTTRGVHQLVALAFLGPCPEGWVVMHKDDDPTNNRVENLAYGTYAQNNWRNRVPILDPDALDAGDFDSGNCACTVDARYGF